VGIRAAYGYRPRMRSPATRGATDRLTRLESHARRPCATSVARASFRS
jgi:hypothetical protein